MIRSCPNFQVVPSVARAMRRESAGFLDYQVAHELIRARSVSDGADPSLTLPAREARRDASMCLFALFFRVVEDAPDVAGAHREEEYALGGLPPGLLEGPVRAIAGTDPVAGGTWFGVNARGVLVAVTNRRRSHAPSPRRSRGLLVRDLLTLPTARAAADTATRELDTGNYDGCNVICADATDAVVVQRGDWLRVRPLPPGIHVIANRDMNDDADPRVVHARGWLEQRRYAGSEHCLMAVRELCGQHEPGRPPMCLRGERHGTVSSSIVALRDPLIRSTYWHAQGPPDRTPFADYSHLFGDLEVACADTPKTGQKSPD